MKYLTVEEIIQIHEKLIEQFGGEQGIVDKNRLDFITSKVQSSRGDVYRKASILLHDIISSHPFIDGNKRVAIEAADTFLRENGKSLELKDINKTGEYINSIAEGKKNMMSIEKWIKEQCD
jgi:death-on-curing protein